MTANMIALMLGLFAVPATLLWFGHRLRKRAVRVRRVFWGAFIGHCAAVVLAVSWSMIPPEMWTSTERMRGFGGFWTLLVFPILGAVYAFLRERQRERGT